MEEHKKFGELSREEKLELMAAWVDGAVIDTLEFERVDGVKIANWTVDIFPCWHPRVTYRVAPKPVVKPSINWDHVAEKFVALAVDEDGAGYLYRGDPVVGADMWRSNIARSAVQPYCYAEPFASFDPGSFTPNKNGIVENWKDSLVFRPGYEPKEN